MAGAVALAAITLLAPSAPTYDPWAWIGWGREVLHGSLSTVDGPSWKPLPVLLSTGFAAFGRAAPDLWLAVARAGGLLGLVAVACCAARLVPRRGRWVAATVAVLALAVAGLNFQLPGDGYLGAAWVGNSEGLLVACVLGALLAGLHRRLGTAWTLTVAAALLRPESWPFGLVLGLWLWRREPGLRPWLLAGLLVVPALWFGVELWGSGQLFRGAQRAQAITPDNPATTGQAARTVLSRARSYLPIGVQVAVLVAGLWAVVGLGRRRVRGSGADLAVVALGLFGAAWLALVAFMAQARLASGNPRYVLLAIAAAAVLAGVGAGRLAAAMPRAGLVASVGLGLGVTGLLALSAAAQLRATGRAVDHLRYEAHLDSDLGRAVTRAGGPAAVLRCGAPVTGPLEVTALSWRLDVPVHRVGLDPGPGTVVFRSAPTLDDPPAPPTTAGLPVRIAAGAWSVSSACG